MKVKTKMNKGITLIALVITIVVLLILAGVTIATLSGDNGILQRASEAKKGSNKAGAEEVIKLLLSEVQIERNIGIKSIETLLEERFDTVLPDGENYIVTKNGYEALVDKNGTLIGEVKKAGPRPIVDEASIKITTDGTTVPEDGTVQKGTPLKINFTATIEGGTISKIEPAVPYTTTGTEMSKEFIITGTTQDGTYTIKKTIDIKKKYDIDHSEEIVNKQTSGIPTEIQNAIDEGKISEVREGNIPIPVGYKYIKGDQIGGAVIREEGSTEQEPVEFVWVPVPDITKMVGGTEKQNNEGERWGKLYSEINIDNPENGTDIAKPTNTGNREPDVLTDIEYTDGKQSNLDIMNNILGTSYDINSFKTELQKDFYNMSESVKKYKGFYVGRYESSLVGSDNNAYLAPIKGKTSATNDASSANTWYGLYARQKKYKKGQIEGSMIWGCQYDAMMKWMKRVGVKNIETENPINIGGEVASKNVGRTTGTVETDKLCNMYDLLGNSYEWTLEARRRRASSRVARGGYYDRSNSPVYRSNNGPNGINSFNSTRATLYIP